MQVKHMFVNVDERHAEATEALPEGKYQLIGDPVLEVTFNKYETGDTEYTFKYRVGRIG